MLLVQNWECKNWRQIGVKFADAVRCRSVKNASLAEDKFWSRVFENSRFRTAPRGCQTQIQGASVEEEAGVRVSALHLFFVMCP